MQIQWYPGHMMKAKRAMIEDLKLVDLVIELTDARVPASGRNPDIDALASGKKRLILLNKADLADEQATADWISYWREQGTDAIPLDARSRTFRRQVTDRVMTACREKLERDKRRGIQNRPIRAMVLGIPNVGKSTFINSFAGRTGAKTGDKPGVTKGNQWIRIDTKLELLDTPGILWPKFEDQQVGLMLAMAGSISDDVLPMEEVALAWVKRMQDLYPQRLCERYGVSAQAEPLAVMDAAARRRGCLKKGGEPDYEKISRAMLDDFRKGSLGRITLEHVRMQKKETP